MRAMNSRCAAVLFFFFAGADLFGAGASTPSAREAAVNDSFDWASGLIDGLGWLAPQPQVPLPARVAGAKPIVKAAKQRRPVRSAPVPAPAPVLRELSLKKSTVFGIFDCHVSETGMESFRLVVGSEYPAENIVVKDSVSQRVYVDHPLDDERQFVVEVPAHLGGSIAVAVSVVQDSEINKAYFPLLGDEK